jgi:hypothetical protein
MKFKKMNEKAISGYTVTQSAHFATHEMSPFNSLLSYMAFTCAVSTQPQSLVTISA